MRWKFVTRENNGASNRALLLGIQLGSITTWIILICNADEGDRSTGNYTINYQLSESV